MKQEFEVGKEFSGERIDKYLAQACAGQSRSFFQKLIQEGQVTVGGNIITKSSFLVNGGDAISVLIPQPQSVEILPEDIPLDILYEDRDVLIVNKPKGMVVHPSAGHCGGTLVNAVLCHCAGSLSGINGEARPGIVHRIDKDTTGSLIVCKNDRAHLHIAAQIQAHSVTRIYRGIVCGDLKKKRGTIDEPIGRHPTQRKKMSVNFPNGKNAVTHYRVLESFKKYTYAEFQLETGRTHQIRVHMSHIGHPLLGDELYGGMTNNHAVPGLCGQTLHAMTIGFLHPTREEFMEFSAPLPQYFLKLLSLFTDV